MPHSRAFFDLNLRFAQQAQRALALPRAEVLLCYTHLYLAFGLGRLFDPADPTWQAYLSRCCAWKVPSRRSMNSMDWAKAASCNLAG